MKKLISKILNIKTIYIFVFSFILLNTLIVINLYNKDKSKENILRLHVVANSNSISDQIIKLKIATKINDFIDENLSNISDKKELISKLEDNSDNILEISNNILKNEDIDYSSTLKIGKISYDAKYSFNMDMEKGTYDSIQIMLGNGEGKNFWTLIFPDKNSIYKLKDYDTILPNLSNIYSNDEEIEDVLKEEVLEEESEKKVFSSKILEFIDSIKK